MTVRIRPEVEALARLGPFPSEAVADQSDLDRIKAALEAIEPPLTADEVRVLWKSLSPHEDTCFGLSFTLVDLIESAGTAVLNGIPHENEGPWARRLRETAARWT